MEAGKEDEPGVKAEGWGDGRRVRGDEDLFLIDYTLPHSNPTVGYTSIVRRSTPVMSCAGALCVSSVSVRVRFDGNPSGTNLCVSGGSECCDPFEKWCGTVRFKLVSLSLFSYYPLPPFGLTLPLANRQRSEHAGHSPAVPSTTSQWEWWERRGEQKTSGAFSLFSVTYLSCRSKEFSMPKEVVQELVAVSSIPIAMPDEENSPDWRRLKSNNSKRRSRESFS
jgi:hypothetical protein